MVGDRAHVDDAEPGDSGLGVKFGDDENSDECQDGGNDEDSDCQHVCLLGLAEDDDADGHGDKWINDREASDDKIGRTGSVRVLDEPPSEQAGKDEPDDAEHRKPLEVALLDPSENNLGECGDESVEYSGAEDKDQGAHAGVKTEGERAEYGENDRENDKNSDEFVVSDDVVDGDECGDGDEKRDTPRAECDAP